MNQIIVQSNQDNNQEIVYCFCLGLKVLPTFTYCRILSCHSNQLEFLPDLPFCERLYCSNNFLTSLSNLPQCVILHCQFNRLKKIDYLPKCKILYCNNNQLESLPLLPNCESLYCSSNNLPYDSLEEHKIFWRFKTLFLQIKYFRLMYKKMVILKTNKKYELHLELKYSPELPFYKNDPYYLHFKNCQQSNS